jgi:hypothetical protein
MVIQVHQNNKNGEYQKDRRSKYSRTEGAVTTVSEIRVLIRLVERLCSKPWTMRAAWTWTLCFEIDGAVVANFHGIWWRGDVVEGFVAGPFLGLSEGDALLTLGARLLQGRQRRSLWKMDMSIKSCHFHMSCRRP